MICIRVDIAGPLTSMQHLTLQKPLNATLPLRARPKAVAAAVATMLLTFPPAAAMAATATSAGSGAAAITVDSAPGISTAKSATTASTAARPVATSASTATQDVASTSSAASMVTMSLAAQKTENVVTGHPSRETLERTLPAMAQIQPDTRLVVHVRPAGSGKVLAVSVIPGQKVKRGEGLIDYTDHALHVTQLQRAQAQAALAAARAEQTDARLAYDRGRALVGATVSQGELQRRTAMLQQADANLAAREADVGTISHRFQEEYTSVTERIDEDERSTLLSPVDGVVQSIAAAPGADIEAGTDVATVADLSHVWFVAWIAPENAAQLSPGGRFDARPAGQGTNNGDDAQTEGDETWPWSGKIASIDQTADPTNGLLRVIAEVANPDGALRPGAMLDARLHTTAQQTGVTVPSDAVQRIDGRDFVFVQETPERFRPAPVVTGLENGGRVIIRSGLRGDETIVTQGAFVLKSIGAVAQLGDDD